MPGCKIFFVLTGELLRTRREALPIHHTAAGEAEHLFKFVNNHGRKCDGGVAASSRAVPGNQARLKNGSMRCALRTKPIMITTPITNSTACRI